MLEKRCQGPTRDFIGYGRNPPFVRWPGDALLAINFVVVYEEGAEYSIPDGDANSDNWGEFDLKVRPGIRDLGTETHFEYGSRAGIWRIARLCDRLELPVTVAACAQALERNPAVVDWLMERGHDILGHGYRWVQTWEMSREAERQDLHLAIESYERLTGAPPPGWNCRSFPSVFTRELILEAGRFLYYSDPCNDDLPYFVEAGGERMLVVPYSKTLNDSRYLVAPGYANPRDFVEDCRAAIDFLVDEAEAFGGRMLTIAVHARWTGQPNRAAGLRDVLEFASAKPGVAFMRRADIARFWIEEYGSLPSQPAACTQEETS